MLNTKLVLVSAFALAHVALTSAAKVIVKSLYYDTDKYYTEITIGNPAQTFRVALDTDSTLTWVHGIECPDMDCNRTRFNNIGDVASKGYKSIGDGDEQFYSYDALNRKSYIAGFLGTDTISLQGLAVEQDFVPVSESHKVFRTFADVDAKYTPEGVLGLGVSRSISTRAIKSLRSVSMPRPYTSFVRNLAEKGLIDKSFSLYFNDIPDRSNTNSEFVLGGFNQDRINEAPHYIPVYRPEESNTGIHWQVFGQAFRVSELEWRPKLLNNQVAHPDKTAPGDIISSVIYEERFERNRNEVFRFATGIPFSKLKSSYNNRLYKAFTGVEPGKKHKLEPNSYVIECGYQAEYSKIMRISFSHQLDSDTDPKPVHVEFPLSKLVRLYFDDTGTQQGCVWGPQDTEDDSDQVMYLGQDILRNIYMTFDFNDYRIGLASAKDTPTKIIVE
ncbi:hypothetical protein MAM1_0083c04621 [Mucor ambiguus]|uniref:Peptidase A1 domain-containing protein n=1 Tax=Mucor ambiguus TaxID=91626 RepID=A0A0C9MPF5_9FUNG|nr:hypothetical protein MAM1_0083c04621 [Mucor ambiguus]